MTVDSQTPLIEVRSLYKAHGTRWAVEDVSFNLHRGRLVHLRGANGAGKTTLLRMLAGELAPSQGEIFIDGVPLGPEPTKGRHRISFVPEILLPSPWLTVEEYLAFRAALRGRDSGSAGALAKRTVEEWELSTLSGRPLDTLSHGERRRVVVAAALQSNPDILLLDEPTIGLDKHQRTSLAERLTCATANRAILVASHVERQGLPEPDEALVLADGHLVEATS